MQDKITFEKRLFMSILREAPIILSVFAAPCSGMCDNSKAYDSHIDS